MTPLFKANVDALNQLKTLISLCIDDGYLPCEYESTSGIGQHVRHILDHYRALQMGYVNQIIDYNFRTRNSAEETDHLLAVEEINKIIFWLENTNIEYSDVTVISEISIHSTQSTTLNSNFDRESLYLINHTIHHMAYATLLAKNKGIVIPNTIGLAPSTATYERQKNKTATADDQ